LAGQVAVVPTGVVVVGPTVVVGSGRVVVETGRVVVVEARLVEVEPTVDVVEGWLVVVGSSDVGVVAPVVGSDVDGTLDSPVVDGPDCTSGEVGDGIWGRKPANVAPLPEPNTTEPTTWIPDGSGSFDITVDETSGPDATTSVASTSAAVESSVHHSTATSKAATRTLAGMMAAATAISRPTRTLSRSR